MQCLHRGRYNNGIMKLADTHAHLYLPHFKEDLGNVINNARNNGVSHIMLPNIDTKSVEPMLGVCNSYPGYCLPMLGLHPTSVKKDFEEKLELLEKYLEKGSFIAIGETGMDAHWDTSCLDQQETSFKRHLEWAADLRLPVVIHSRKTTDIITSILKKGYAGKVKGVFHAFSGSVEQAREITGMGFKLGIGGVVTYPRSGLDDVIREIDLENIILETDSPYLTPVPKRGKRNESAYLVYIAEKIAKIRGVAVSEVAVTTTGNALELFNLSNS